MRQVIEAALEPIDSPTVDPALRMDTPGNEAHASA
jgi:hypothetical protein